MKVQGSRPVLSTAIAVFAVCFVLNGCGFLRGSTACDKRTAYLKSEDRGELAVPEDLSPPDYGDGLRIPSVEEGDPLPESDNRCLEEPPTQVPEQTTDIMDQESANDTGGRAPDASR